MVNFTCVHLCTLFQNLCSRASERFVCSENIVEFWAESRIVNGVWFCASFCTQLYSICWLPWEDIPLFRFVRMKKKLKFSSWNKSIYWKLFEFGRFTSYPLLVVQANLLSSLFSKQKALHILTRKGLLFIASFFIQILWRHLFLMGAFR